ncbi:MAG: hypothetical protein LBL04_07130 [Bacteroidales bacterium]|jgi:hypothetical protein|nr:hypothetical protein [Bacteroidales bacterium]
MMQDKKYHKSDRLRLAAYLLLVIFMSFSIQLPLLNKEVHENDHITEQILIGLQESITANSIYQAPTFKYDFGQHRVALYFHKLLKWSLFCFNSESGTIQKPTARDTFPLSTIPAYILDRVLRI